MAQSRTYKTIILASGRVLTNFAGLAIFVVLSHILDLHDYATYRQTMLAYLSVAPLLTMALPQAMYYFLPAGEGRYRAILMENLTLLTALGSLFSLFLLLGGNQLLARSFDNPDLAFTLLILVPYPLFMLPVTSFDSCLIARDRVDRVAIFNVISRTIYLVSVVSLCLVWRTPEAALAGAVLGAAIMFFPAMRLMFGACRSETWRPTASGMWSQVKYSVPLGAAAMIGTVYMNLDKWIISALFSTDVVAVYMNGAMQIPLIRVVTASAMAIILPEMVAMYKDGRIGESLELWKRAARKCALIIFPAMAFLFVLAPQVMRLLYSAKYEESAYPFRIYLLLLPIRVVQFGVIFMAAGKGWIILVQSSISLAINVALSLYLVSQIGYIGAAMGSVLTIYLWSLPFNLVFARRLMKARYRELLPFGHLFKIFAACLVCAVPLLAMTRTVRAPDAVLVGAGVAVYGALLLLLLSWMKYVRIGDLVAGARKLKGRFTSS